MRTIPRNKKILVTGSVGVLLVIGAVLALLVASNRIIKEQIEKALGGNSTVERVSLGWNKVELTGLRLFPNGPTTISAEKVDIRASFLTVLQKRYSVSSLTIRKPSVKLQINRNGRLDNPFSSEGKEPEKKDSSGTVPPIGLKSVTLTNGSLVIADDRTGDRENMIELTGIELQANNLSFPDMNRMSRVSFRTAIGGKILSGEINANGKINLGNPSGELKIEASNIRAVADSRGPRLKAKLVKCGASLRPSDAQGRTVVLSDVQLQDPFIRLEEDRAGRFVNPFSLERKKTPAEKERGEKVALIFNGVKISGGEVLYLDGTIATPPHPIRITDIVAALDVFSLPVSNRQTVWRLSSRIPGKGAVGTIEGSGSTNFHDLDTKGRIVLRGLDLITLRPYIVKKGQADVVGGTLDMDVDVSVRSRAIHAPTHAVIRNLRLASGGRSSDVFLGVPRTLIIKLLETSKNELPLDFIVEGNLDNPRFSLQESFVRRFTVSLGRKLGVSVIETGESVIIQGGKVLKGIGSGLRDLWK